jgi:hypothetical protein
MRRESGSQGGSLLLQGFDGDPALDGVGSKRQDAGRTLRCTDEWDVQKQDADRGDLLSASADHTHLPSELAGRVHPNTTSTGPGDSSTHEVR